MDTSRGHTKKTDETVETSASEKPRRPWEKPKIRASADLDQQALGCASGSGMPPFCTFAPGSV